MDKNRASDGLDLRRGYLNQYEEPDNCDLYYHLGGYCSILEMMIALAGRCEHEYMGDPLEEDHSSVWFWVMISGLGLENMTNSEFSIDFCDQIIAEFLDTFSDKTLFGNDKTSKKMQIWDQLMKFLSDNYVFGL